MYMYLYSEKTTPQSLQFMLCLDCFGLVHKLETSLECCSHAPAEVCEQRLGNRCVGGTAMR